MENVERNQCMSTMTSGNEWFWRNYNTCLQWQERHKIAYWKSKALALEYERDALRQYIQSVCANNKFGAVNSHHDRSTMKTNSYGYVEPGSNSSASNSRYKRHNARGSKSKKKSRTSGKNRPKQSTINVRRNEHNAANGEAGVINPKPGKDDAIDPESQIDDDLLEFFKQSMKHKMELKQKRKASEESDSTDSSIFNKKSHSAQRSEEMRLLYGVKSPMIQGMETAMQLTFERNCDKLNPVLWPILPLKM